MAENISITMTGAKSLGKFLNKKNTKINQIVENAIKQVGFFMEGEVKDSIAGRRAEPRTVDTGRLLNSVKSTNPRKFQSKVETNVEYAKHLEHGTSKLAPRHHFKNSATRNKTKINRFIQSKVDKA